MKISNRLLQLNPQPFTQEFINDLIALERRLETAERELKKEREYGWELENRIHSLESLVHLATKRMVAGIVEL